MAEIARSVSEWHQRMTAEKLNQSGQPVDMAKFPVGTRVFFYKPSLKQEADSKGRRAKHIEHILRRTGKSDKLHWHKISTAGNERGC